MVVLNSVTFSVTQIDSQVDRSKALNYIRSGQHLLLPSVKMARHTYSVHHNWSLLKCNAPPPGELGRQNLSIRRCELVFAL